jgi:alkylation response protein AidB-like acyl-CoA dehydrogenase
VSALEELYSIPQEHLDFRDTIRQITRERVAPRAAEIDEKAEYPHDLRKLFAEQDLLGLPFDTEHGGTGTGTLMLNMAVEEVSKACASSALEAGSDPGGMLTRAVRDGEEWVIDGTKNWITNLGIADFYVVFAVTDKDAGHSRGITAFVVEADRPGFSVGKLEH